MSQIPDFESHPSTSIVANPALVPEAPGVYLIGIQSAQRFLNKVGYYDFDNKPPIVMEGFELCYAGATSASLRNRILDHLRCGSEVSSFRQSVGALIAGDLGLDVVGAHNRASLHFGDTEQRLTSWLMEHTSVSFATNDNPFLLERDLLHSIALPLNISERKRHPFSRYLLSLRATLARRPSGTSVTLVRDSPPLSERRPYQIGATVAA